MSIWTLTAGETIFAISDGVSRIHQTLGRLGVGMQQNTQVEQPSRAAWPVAFPDHATRTLSFELPVTFPPCASYEAAFQQSLDIPVQCPRGGVLTGLIGADQRTYAQAWINAISVEPLGVTNQFTFNITAVNPSSATLSRIALMDPRYPNILTSMTGLTGGGTGKLDAQVTTDVAVGRMVDFYLDNGSGVLLPHRWVLMPWTDETEDAADGRVLPDDFHATTNPKFWQRLI